MKGVQAKNGSQSIFITSMAAGLSWQRMYYAITQMMGGRGFFLPNDLFLPTHLVDGKNPDTET